MLDHDLGAAQNAAMKSIQQRLCSALRWFADAIWSLSKRFPALHLLLFIVVIAAGALIAWDVPHHLPDLAAAALGLGLILGVAGLTMLIRAGIALVRGRWPEYCDVESARARAFYDPERFR